MSDNRYDLSHQGSPSHDRAKDQQHERPDSYYQSRQAANFHTGRRENSRSPQDYYRGDDTRGHEGRRDQHRVEYDQRYDDERMYDDDYQPERRDVASQHDDRAIDHQRNTDRRAPSGGRAYEEHGSYDAGSPTDTVILESLPFSPSAVELRDLILEDTAARDFQSVDVRISASRGNRRAFLQFDSVDSAVTFVKAHSPKIRFDLGHTTDDVPDGKFDSLVHYARVRDEQDQRIPGKGTWNCPSCDYANYLTRNRCKVCGEDQSAAAEVQWQQSLSGAADATNVPSQILVIYPLAPFVNEEMLEMDLKRLELDKPDSAKEASNGTGKLKSTAPTGNPTGYGARPGSLHRVFLMRDASSDESLKFGFAEFWTLEDAAAAMTKFQMSRSFTVAACAATVSHTHMGVFVPEERETHSEIDCMSFHPLFNPSLRVRYRDSRAYPSQRTVTSEAPGRGRTQPVEFTEPDGKQSKKRKAEGPSGSTAKRAVPMSGQLALWQKKHVELHVGGQGESNSADQPTTKKLGQAPAKNDSKATIRISIGASATNMDSANVEQTTTSSTPRSDQQGTRVDASDSREDVTAPDPTPVSYVDRDRLMCLICMRKYKSVEEVDIHERSKNHKTAMDNEELVKAALPRIAARNKRLQKEAPIDDTGASQYRDRAKERRTAHSQPNKPKTKPVGQGPKQEAKKQEVKNTESPKPAQSKGAGMLAKMGWAAGGGLGANGEGRTGVIETKAYQGGVGLGAEGGDLGDAAELAQRRTNGTYADYVNSVQDKARQRYSNLGQGPGSGG